MGYGWEKGIPVCPHHGVVPGMQNPSAGHPHIYWMERSVHCQASLGRHWDTGTVFEQLYLLAPWYQSCANITTGMELLSSSCSLGFAAFWDHPHPLWQCGEGGKGLSGSWRQTKGQQTDSVTRWVPPGFGQSISLKASPSR